MAGGGRRQRPGPATASPLPPEGDDLVAPRVTLLVDRSAGSAELPPAGDRSPQQGVIEEARRRKRERRLRWAAVVLAIASLAALAAALTFAGGGARAPEAPLHLPAEATGAASGTPIGLRARSRSAVSPNLNGAEAGWCIHVILRGVITGGCAPLPTATTLVLSDGTSWGHGEREDTTVA